MTLPQFGVSRPVATTMVFLAILVLGLFSLYKLPLDLMPEIEPPAISVITPWPGASTEDVETKVTRTIENALSIVNNLDKITSQTREGMSIVTCEFTWGTDLDDASNDIRDRLEFVKSLLPDDVETPIVFKFNTANFPIMVLNVRGRESWERMDTLINDELADPLKRLPGVGGVSVFGAPIRQIRILLNRERLAAANVLISDVLQALAAENLTLPAGSMKIGPQEFTIRVPGDYEHPDQIPDIPVKRSGDRLLRLRDVADVVDGFEEETRLVEAMGQRGMIVLVQKRSGANTVDVCDTVRRALDKIVMQLPRDIEISTILDSSEYILQSVQNVSRTVLWGGLFVVLTALFFLRSFRSSLVIALTIPFSLIIAFTFMFVMGWTLNVLSFAALAIAIGMVVDNAVVVLENVSRHADRGVKIREASVFGAQEVGLAIAASTLTTIVVFLPLIFVKGIIGIFFTQLAGIVTLTLMASLFCALLFTPMLCSRLLKPAAVRRAGLSPLGRQLFDLSERGFVGIESAYSRFLGWALRHRPIVLLGAFALLCGALLLAPRIGTEFMPEQDSAMVTLTVELPVSTRVETTAALMRRIVPIVEEVVEPGAVRLYAWRCGAPRQASFGGRDGANIGTFNLRLVPKTQRRQSSKAIGNAIADRIRSWPEIVKLNVDIGDPLAQRLMGGGGKPIAVEILGHDLEQTDRLAREIKALAENIPGTRDVTISRDLGNLEVAVRIDREKAAALGLPVRWIAESLRTLFYGSTATQYREGEKQYDVFVQLDEPQRRSFEDLRNTELALPTGARIRLDAVADIVETRGPVTIERLDQERLVKVEMNFLGRPMGDVAADLQRIIAERIVPPPGVAIQMGGLVREQSRSFRDLFLLIGLGFILVYIVMAAQFESLLDPFIIMFAVPFGFTGVLAALYLTRTPISVMSLIGVILLVGTVVNNAIVLVDYINLLRARGMELGEAIRTSGQTRLRPVLITTLTTVFGMLPLAIREDVGSESWQPLGITVIGGLLAGMFASLVLVPVLYSLFAIRNRIGNGVSS